MGLMIEIVVYGGIIPTVVSLAMAALLLGVLPESASRRYAAAVAFGTALLVGYLLMPSWAELVPTRHWHWLPYLAAAAMILAPIGLAQGLSTPERWLLHLLFSAVAAWLLVPTWPNLQPPRSFYVPVVAGYLFLITVLLEALPARLLGPLFVAILFVVSALVAMTIAATVSVRLGQVGGIAAAAMAGCGAASFFYSSRFMARGLIPVFTIVVGGLALVGCVEPERPLVGLLLMPAAPLALWACACGPLARARGVAAGASQAAVVLVPLVAAIAWVVIGEATSTSGGY